MVSDPPWSDFPFFLSIEKTPMTRREDTQYQRNVGSRTERSRSRSREALSRRNLRPSDAYDESRRHDNHGGSQNDIFQNDARSRYERRSPPTRRDHRNEARLPLRTRPVPREDRGRYSRDDDSPRNQDYDRRNRRSQERQRRTPRENNRGDEREAPLHQQIAWGKHITRSGMTPEAILALFEQNGDQLSAGNSRRRCAFLKGSSGVA